MKKWQTTAIMPGLAARVDISDNDLAAIATYIRNSWGNKADTKREFSPLVFTKVRKETKGRNMPYIEKDIKSGSK